MTECKVYGSCWMLTVVVNLPVKVVVYERKGLGVEECGNALNRQ
jgi:hypothetical protein